MTFFEVKNMIKEEFSRTALLFGEEGLERLSAARVAVFGIGGVGGHAAEALVRSGIGAIDLIDSDTVSVSNLNRQLVALHSTVGKYKVDIARERFLDINPELKIKTYKTFYTPETAAEFNFFDYDYVIDAIDTVTGKIGLVMQAQEAGTPIICSMGAGNKLDPSAFEVADIYKTSVCPLAKVMRYELKKRGVKRLKVVYSRELPRTPDLSLTSEKPVGTRRTIPGSTAFVPSAAGLILAGEVIRDIAGIK